MENIKKLYLPLFSFLLFSFFFVLPGNIYAVFSGSGGGTSVGPYIITTCLQLQEMSDEWAAVYELGNDIECGAGASPENNTYNWNGGAGFEPVGNIYNSFTGELRGNGYKIKGLYINRPSSGGVGLFANLDGVVSEVGLVDVDITGLTRVGALAGIAAESIDSAYSTGTINGEAEVSGLVGENYGTIRKSYSSVTVTASGDYAGGLVAYNIGRIDNSYATGDVVNSVGSATGGLVGSNDGGEIVDTYATGDITGQDFIGGLVGVNDGGQVVNSFAVGKVLSDITPSAAGGLIGGLEGVGFATNSFYYYDASIPGNDWDNGIGSQVTDISDFYNKSFDVYDGGGEDEWDFINTWVEHSDAFPTFVWQIPPPDPTPTPSSNSSSDSSSPASPPSCNDSAPTSVPNLFQIDSAGTYANLYFTGVNGATGYSINYGLTPQADQYGDLSSDSASGWVIGRTISGLSPNTAYYFRVQALNGCNGGDWSQTVQVKTKGLFSNITQWFANLTPVKPQPQPAGMSTNVLGASTTTGCSYEVRPGDSLWSIASKGLGSGVKYQQLMEKNNLNSTKLQIGQKLKVSC